ncbi:hypothetical protein A2943_02690 [Candidatus Adlerbacteria bacterium RIFCSPLOWO2_01_FULL_51_16]|uniref:VOC domain-containing protein n=1 Tax=Candidatus Adlerbacteria bacterium RIFCSPLOWO2_01_FULL_51_16 TaxID=1797243 RepID=A0A1F4XGP8_9BACT|nr:MAG: hypothetical protein A2943_02690 [Candidatus Adlerbacteria bacterium RIFCSPLOWO2_01_FULL_51_16]
MNRVVHFEIQADDLDRAQKFYESVFGWKFIETGPGFGGYRIVVTGPGPDEIVKGKVTMENVGINGGLMKRNAPLPPDGHSPNAFTCIVAVDDIDAYIAKADAAGAKPQTEKMNVPGVGLLRYYKDTEGNIFGMIQPVMSPQK